MKIARHAKIIDLISRNDVETQEELADLLNGEGFRVTQATVSRDIRELKLTKISLLSGGEGSSGQCAAAGGTGKLFAGDVSGRFSTVLAGI